MVATILLLAAGPGRGDHRPAPAQDLQLDDLPRHPPGGAGRSAGGVACARWRPSGNRLAAWAGFRSAHEPLGLAACGLVMLVCFVIFRVGGGDVKLIAMLGAFLDRSKGSKPCCGRSCSADAWADRVGLARRARARCRPRVPPNRLVVAVCHWSPLTEPNAPSFSRRCSWPPAPWRRW